MTPSIPHLVIAFGASLAGIGVIFLVSHASVEHGALVACGGWIILCGLLKLGKSEAPDKIAPGVALAMIVVGYTWQHFGPSNRASALAAISGILVLLLVAGRPGRVRILTASAGMFFILVGYGRAAILHWNAVPMPEDARKAVVALHLVDSETSWSALTAGQSLPDGIEVVGEHFRADGESIVVEHLAVAPQEGESRTEAQDRAEAWVAQHVHVPQGGEVVFTGKPRSPALQAFVLEETALLDGEWVEEAAAERGDDGQWSLAITFTPDARDKLSRSSGRAAVITVEDLIQYGPVALVEPASSHMTFTLGGDGDEEHADFLAKALRGGIWILDQ